jgi:glycosyltransferase involved in cell wall biosynthesis
MRILVLTTWFPYPPDNGSKIRVYHLLRALAQRHEVTLLSFSWDTASPEQAKPLRDLNVSMQTVPLNPFEVNRASTLRTFLSLRPMASRSIPPMHKLMTNVLCGQAFNAVIASTEVTAPYALQTPSCMVRTCMVRILEEHNAMSRWAWERYTKQRNSAQRLRCWLSWQKIRHYEARLFKLFDLVTVVSEQDRTACLKNLPGYRGPIAIIPNGVDCAHHQPGLTEVCPNTLVYNGSLTYSANYDAIQYFLAEIFPIIKKEISDVTLSITGSTQGVNLSGLKLDDSVFLTGYVEDVRPPVATSTACIIPIRQGGGTRLKILEAMALGTPVVSTSKGAEGLDLTPGEHLLTADNPRAFAAQVIRLLRQPDLQQRLARQARQRVEREYDWQKIGQRFVDLVEDIAGAG